MEAEGPYTTITVKEWNRISFVIKFLREKIQGARMLLENGLPREALELLRKEDEHESTDGV